ncbi:hypothetical protein Tco_0151397 [Tanacetum coccineum]
MIGPVKEEWEKNNVGNGSIAATSMDEASAHIASSSDECRVRIGVSGIGADFVVNDAGTVEGGEFTVTIADVWRCVTRARRVSKDQEHVAYWL